MRTMQGARGALLLAGLGATYGAPAHAQANIKDVCVAAAEEGQELETKRQLVAAREKFLVCSRSACPAAVVRDCAKWLAAVEGSLSSVVFAARHADEDLTDVAVHVDGQRLTSTLDGRALPLDPGTHLIAMDWVGRHVEQRIVVAEGEKNRKVSLVFDDAASARSPVARDPMDRRGPAGPSRPVPLLTYVLGGVAIAGFGSAVGFGIAGRSQLDDLHRCAPHCPSSDVTALRTDMVITNLSLGIGVLAAGIATWIFLTRPTVYPAEARSSGTLVVW